MPLLDLEVARSRQWGRVGDLFEVTKKPRVLPTFEGDFVPFASMDAVPLGRFSDPCYEMRPWNGRGTGTYFERGDILVARITPSFENGKQATTNDLPTPFGFGTTEVIPLRPISGSGADSRLLYFYLLHPEIRRFLAERMEGSTGRQRVSDDTLLELPYPARGAEEQRRIGDVVARIFEAIDAEAAAEAAAVTLKRGVMAQAFTLGLRGESRKQTDLGDMPEGWDVVEFSELRESLRYGTSHRCTTAAAAYPVLRIPNVLSARIDASDIKYCDLPDEQATRYELHDGDLLFIRTNGVLERLGLCAAYHGTPHKALFASYLIRARLLNGVDADFVAYFMGSRIGVHQIGSRATPAADGKFNLNTAIIDSLLVPLPPLEEQLEIVALLRTIDERLDVRHNKLARLNELFQRVLHDLVTGKVSVDDLVDQALPTGIAR